jgi:hypothetical protein
MLLLGDVSLHTHHVTLLFPFGVCLAALLGDVTGPPRWLIEVGLPAAIALMLMGGIRIGKIFSTLVLADLLLLACMMGLMLGVVSVPRPEQSPCEPVDR